MVTEAVAALYECWKAIKELQEGFSNLDWLVTSLSPLLSEDGTAGGIIRSLEANEEHFTALSDAKDSLEQIEAKLCEIKGQLGDNGCNAKLRMLCCVSGKPALPEDYTEELQKMLTDFERKWVLLPCHPDL